MTAPSIAPGNADALRPAYARTDVQTNGRTDERSDLSPVDISPVRYAHEQGKDSSTGGYRTPHGERRTYLAGCRCESCGRAHSRYCKEHRLRLARGHQARVPRDRALAVVDDLNAHGFTDHAIAMTAGLSSSLLPRLRGGTHRSVSHHTYAALSAVTETGTGLVPGGLTQVRIRSLQRNGWNLDTIAAHAGHSIKSGRWRYTGNVSATVAAAVRETYRLLEGRPGDSPYAAGLAASRGYPLPADWDDPGTLAWPPGAPPAVDEGPVVDEVAIDRWFEGHDVALTGDERREVIRLAHDRGVSHTRVAARFRVSGSTLARIRAGDHPGPRRGPDPKDPEAIPHGTDGRYRRGCRCDPCRGADRSRRQRKAPAA